MTVKPEEVLHYLKSLKDGDFHGTVTLGIYNGDISSIKVNMSVDLEYLKQSIKDSGGKS